MKMIKNRSGRFITSIMVIAVISALLITTAGAIAPGMTVSSQGVINNSSLPNTLDYGQVATAKNVSNSTASNFGDGANGQFSVVLSAIGCSHEGEQLIEDAGIIFKDTFEDGYAFVTSPTEMKIYIDGVEETAALVSVNKYVYDNGAATADLVKATFDMEANTIEYIIGENALHTTTASVSEPSTLEFGVRLKNSVVTSGTYNTNLPNSCTADFNALENNSYYWSSFTTNTYINESSFISWETIPNLHNYTRFGASETLTITALNRIRLITEDGGEYVFTDTSPTGEIFYDLSTEGSGWERFWHVGINPGVYYKNGDLLKIPVGIDVPPGYVIESHAWPPDDADPPQYLTRLNTHLYGELQKGTVIIPDPAHFIINTLPTGVGTAVSITVVDTDETFSGTLPTGGYTSPVSWSFTSGTDVITLVNETTLTVTKQVGHWENTTDGQFVRQVLDARGYVTLTTPTPFVVPTGSLTVTKDVTSAPGVTPPSDESFAITVTFTAGSYGILGISGSDRTVSNNGAVITYNLSLKDDQSVVFSDIPATTSYIVSETLMPLQTTLSAVKGMWSGPDATSSNLSGTIAADTANTATVVNNYAVVAGDIDKPDEPTPSADTGVKGDTEILPQTGGISPTTLLGIFGLALISVGGTSFVIYRKKFLN